MLIRVEAIGVNFIEIYFRKGTYKATLPLIPGSEAAGTVEELGVRCDGIQARRPGGFSRRAGQLCGVCAGARSQLVKVPAGLTPEQAAAAMLQGMTAHYLATSTYPLKAGDTALVHAGAGGVGLLLTQIASRIGRARDYDGFDGGEGGVVARGRRFGCDSLHRAGLCS